MKIGVFLPISGRAAGPGTLMEAARKAETWGFYSVWAADRIIIPWEIETSYPYSADNQFIVPPDRPFLEPLTCLAFLAGCTEKIVLGMSVLVLPYRHPLHWAKIITTLDHLSKGRTILGVGVGWLPRPPTVVAVSYRWSVSESQMPSAGGQPCTSRLFDTKPACQPSRGPSPRCASTFTLRAEAVDENRRGAM